MVSSSSSGQYWEKYKPLKAQYISPPPPTAHIAVVGPIQQNPQISSSPDENQFPNFLPFQWALQFPGQRDLSAVLLNIAMLFLWCLNLTKIANSTEDSCLNNFQAVPLSIIIVAPSFSHYASDFELNTSIAYWTTNEMELLSFVIFTGSYWKLKRCNCTRLACCKCWPWHSRPIPM